MRWGVGGPWENRRERELGLIKFGEKKESLFVIEKTQIKQSTVFCAFSQSTTVAKSSLNLARKKGILVTGFLDYYSSSVIMFLLRGLNVFSGEETH